MRVPDRRTGGRGGAAWRCSRPAPPALSIRRPSRCLRMDLYTTLDRSDRAVDVGLDYLRQLGIDWSPHPTEEEVRREYERIWSQLGGRAIEELIDLPLMSEPGIRGRPWMSWTRPCRRHCLRTRICFPWSSAGWSISAWSTATAMRPATPTSMVGAIAGAHFGDYKAGFRFGQLGYDLVEQRGLKRFKARTYMAFGVYIVSWTRHVAHGPRLIRHAFDAANTHRRPHLRGIFAGTT